MSFGVAPKQKLLVYLRVTEAAKPGVVTHLCFVSWKCLLEYPLQALGIRRGGVWACRLGPSLYVRDRNSDNCNGSAALFCYFVCTVVWPVYHLSVCAMETRRGCCTMCVSVPWRPGGGAAPETAVTDHCEPPCG